MISCFNIADINEYHIDFIEQQKFEEHVKKTIKSYNKALKKIDLARFNKNVVDPIKLTFDQALFKKTWEEIIKLEIHRQRDKSNTNAIGYFHQKIFNLFDNCVVPSKGFDVIVTNEDGTHICVEMKNKHNTMNSSSSQKTYSKMLNYLVDHPNDKCYLVEIIAPTSRNIVWDINLDDVHHHHDNIRKVSIDYFYRIVTGKENAFYQICTQLPITIQKLLSEANARTVEKDTVVEELRQKNQDLLTALYLLAFESYLGFETFREMVKKLVEDKLPKSKDK